MRLRPRRLAFLALLLIPVLALSWRLFGPRGFSVKVEAKTWLYEIEVEKRVLETGSGWCDELPPGAGGIERRMIADPSGVRSGLAEHCRYSIPEWRKRWVAQASGPATEPPRWPTPQLVDLPADEIGAERAGKRTQRYLLQLRSERNGVDWSCQLPLEQWQRFQEGESFRLMVDRFSTANCASVPVK